MCSNNNNNNLLLVMFDVYHVTRHDKIILQVNTSNISHANLSREWIILQKDNTKIGDIDNNNSIMVLLG